MNLLISWFIGGIAIFLLMSVFGCENKSDKKNKIKFLKKMSGEEFSQFIDILSLADKNYQKSKKYNISESEECYIVSSVGKESNGVPFLEIRLANDPVLSAGKKALDAMASEMRPN